MSGMVNASSISNVAVNNQLGTTINNLVPPRTLTLTCFKDTKSVNQSVTVTADGAIQSPQITSFTAYPTPVIVSSFTKFMWESSNTTSCSMPQLGNSLPTANPYPNGTSYGPINATATYTLSCTGPGGTANRTLQVPVTQPDSTCRFINLSLTETGSVGSASANTRFTLDSYQATAEDIGVSVFPYEADWDPDYILKTLNVNGAVIGSYNLFSGRFVNAENFTDPTQSELIEVPQASLDAVVLFNPAIRSIQIDTRTPLPLNASALTCVQPYRLLGQTVDFSRGEKCAPGLVSKQFDNLFVCE